ncbi:MAG: methyltransferase domain-containing protein [Pseudomonadota bacterium]
MHALEVTTPISSLHEERLEYTVALLERLNARRVLDLGCGSGALLHRLAVRPGISEVVGVEQCAMALAHARAVLDREVRGGAPRVSLVHGSYGERDPRLAGFDAAVMLETIEHEHPRALSRVEAAVFASFRPATVFITTPNRDHNPLLGLGHGEFRDPDHKFEWSRAKFREWALGVARRQGYRATFGGIGELDPELGPPTQTALFQCRADAA